MLIGEYSVSSKLQMSSKLQIQLREYSLSSKLQMSSKLQILMREYSVTTNEKII